MRCAHNCTPRHEPSLDSPRVFYTPCDLFVRSYGERVRTDVERARRPAGADGEDQRRDALGRRQLAAAAATENVPQTIGYTKTFINEPHQSVTDGPDGPYVQPGRFAQATSSE